MAQSPDPNTGSAQEDFRSVLRGMVQVYSAPTCRVFAQLVGEGQSDPFARYTGSLSATRRSTKRGPTRSSTRRCADSPPVTEITGIFGTLHA
jgi:hypothetical protein